MSTQIDPSKARNWNYPRHRLWCEWTAFKMLMQDLSAAAKIQSTLLMVFWMLWTAALGLGWFETPEGWHTALLWSYGLFTLLIGAIISRMHELEFEKLVGMLENGVNVSLGDPSDDDQDR